MEEDTGPNAEGVGTPEVQGRSVLDRVKMVSLDSKGPHERLDLVTSNETDPGILSVPVDSERGEVLAEGGVAPLELPEILQKTIKASDSVMGGGGVLAKDHHPFLPVLTILLGTVADPEP